MAAEISAVEGSKEQTHSKVSYSIQAVTRYVLSRSYYETDGQGRDSGGCGMIGEFETEAAAQRVREALTK